MKKLFITTLALVSLSVSADPNCFSNEQGEFTHLSKCEIEVSHTLVKQCRDIKVLGKDGGYTYKSVPKKFGWSSITLIDRKCDIALEECREIGRELLERTQESRCGGIARAKKVKIEYFERESGDLKFKRTHKIKLKK